MHGRRLADSSRFVSIAWGLALWSFIQFAAARTASATDGIWSELAPPCRVSHSAIYDPVRDRVVVFGGTDHMLRNDVWVLSLSGTPQWTRLHPVGTPPSPRLAHSAIYDPVGDRMLVFGGDDGVPRADLWQLTLSGTPRWTMLTPGGSVPDARSGHSAIYDPVRHRMILVAGLGASGVLDDVWALSLGGAVAWSPLLPLGPSPSPRMGQAAIYDPPRDRLVLMGGLGELGQMNGETWALSLGASPAWTLIVPSGAGPPPRYRSGAIYDPGGDRMILNGGTAGESSFTTLLDSWQLELSTAQWTLLHIGSLQLYGAGAVYDPVRARMIVAGGSRRLMPCLSTTLALPLSPLGHWTHLIGAGPESVASHTAVFDPVRSRMVTFAGMTMGLLDPDPSNELWFYRPGEATWEYVPAFDPPSSRIGHTAVFDQARDRMLVFGGDEIYGLLQNDTWALEFGSAPFWTQLEPAGTKPSPRLGHAAVLDPVGDRMLIFGGWDGGRVGPPTRYNDVWALRLSPSPSWNLLTPSATTTENGIPMPTPRASHSAVYDPVGRRIVVFGGADGTGSRNDVWVMTLAGSPAWSELLPAGTSPSARSKHVAVYDPIGHQMLVFGGVTSTGRVDDVWALTLGSSPAWFQLAPYGPSPGRPMDHAAVWDPLGQRMLTHGGQGASGVWAFEPPGAAGAEPTQQGGGLAALAVRPNPVVGDLVVSFMLPADGPARLELFDTAGRRVASREVGSLGAGTQRVTLVPAGRLPAGIYLVRLSHATQSLTARAAIVR